MTRRELFDELAAAGLTTGVLAGISGAQNQGPRTAEPHASYDFWSRFFDSELGGSRGLGQPEEQRLAAPERHCRYLFHGDQGLRYATEIRRDDLLDHDGDVAVSFSLGQFRPGAADSQTLQRLQSSQLRVDCVQVRPLINLFAPLAWSAIASVYPDKSGKLPSLQSLGFQSPNGVSKVVLPGGLGKVGVNISMMKKDSVLHQVLKGITRGAAAAGPLLNFPAISLTALKTFTDLYGYLEDRTTFLLNSPLITGVATRAAWQDPDRGATYLPLATGDYVLVPQAHTDELGQALERLEFNQGFLVDRDSSKNQPVETRAAQTVKGVTYVSLRVHVAPLQTASNRGQAAAPEAVPATPKNPAQPASPPKKDSGAPPSKKK